MSSPADWGARAIVGTATAVIERTRRPGRVPGQVQRGAAEQPPPPPDDRRGAAQMHQVGDQQSLVEQITQPVYATEASASFQPPSMPQPSFHL